LARGGAEAAERSFEAAAMSSRAALGC
jgi:hypothetical protein